MGTRRGWRLARAHVGFLGIHGGVCATLTSGDNSSSSLIKAFAGSNEIKFSILGATFKCACAIDGDNKIWLDNDGRWFGLLSWRLVSRRRWWKVLPNGKNVCECLIVVAVVIFLGGVPRVDEELG
jgi:hypothetical protein